MASTKSADVAPSTTSTPAVEETEQKITENVADRVASLPLVSSAYDMVSAAYTSTKESHPYMKSVCDMAEKGVKTIASVAATGAQPILNKLEPQISTANEYALKGLDKLEEKLPILQQPTDKIISGTKDLVTGAKEAVSSTVSGMVDRTKEVVQGGVEMTRSAVQGGVDMTRSAVQSGVEMTRSAVSSSVNTVMESSVGQMVSSNLEAALGKSEEIVDHYLPMTDEELAQLATSVEGFEAGTVEQQKEQKSYFVRLGSLSSKLRHRAFQHSLAKLKKAKQGTQDTLSQLHQTIELIEHVKQGVDQKIQGGQEKLHQMWLQWQQKQSPKKTQKDAPETQEIGSQALEVSRGLTQQLQSTTTTLVSNLQGLPAGLQEKVGLVRQNVEELRSAFMTAGSFQDLSGSILAQSREKVAKARQLTDELMDHVVQNVPLTWLVGPFAASGKKEEEGIEMK
ncbi:perilipin-3-like [Protobothrops mucrosquamatus]|uniref:perilipin-3-like n=1 Tax=Protobothrops mucrosquamatus TaxID=103944 RepID=UPI00077575B6|nr:perilipin-3-like [Protobothrops mucrosquamatus]